MNLYDDPPETPEDRRDAGMAQVVANNETWADKVFGLIGSLPIGWRGIGETIRVMAEERGLVPKHPNAWGGAIGRAVRAKMLVETGKRFKMTTFKSNARKSPEYVRADPEAVRELD